MGLLAAFLVGGTAAYVAIGEPYLLADIENLPPDRFEQKVRRAIDEGAAGEGRGFVLMPSAAPYGRTITPQTMRNYETMIRLVQS